MFRPEDIDDLIEISGVWGIPVATVVWTIAVDQIARWRRQAPNLGQHGLAPRVFASSTRLIWAAQHPGRVRPLLGLNLGPLDA